MPASSTRVADRFLTAAVEVPSVVRRKEDAQALVDSLSPLELEIIHHIWSGGTVSYSIGNDHVTLGPPLGKKKPTKADYEFISGGSAAMTRLARSGWVRKVSQTPDGTFFFWWLTDNAQKVFRLVEPRKASTDLPQATREVWNLTQASHGLNFADEEDRITFRGMVLEQTKHAQVVLLRHLAAALNTPVSGTASRVDVARAIAAGWMKGNRLN